VTFLEGVWYMLGLVLGSILTLSNLTLMTVL
jgi:hypothetical protein